MLVRTASEPSTHSAKSAEGLALIAWLLPMIWAVLARTDLKAVSSDQLGMYRYTADIIAYFRDGVPIAWVVHLGARYFPDLLISFVAYALGLGDPRAWGAIFALLNLGLVYAALRILLWTSGARGDEPRLIGMTFMAVLLVLIAISFRVASISWTRPTTTR